MRKIHLFIVVFITGIVTAQKFAPGYYIDANNIKHEGFIEDTNPLQNPTSIVFKSDMNSDAATIEMPFISEFKIAGHYKYVKFYAPYDYDQVTSKGIEDITNSNLNIKQKEILLKVLVEGTYTLYIAIIDKATFYYVKSNTDKEVTLLEYRKYVVEEKLKETNSFRIQLMKLLGGKLNVPSRYQNLQYNEDLIDLIKEYNKADNSLVQETFNHKKYDNEVLYKVFGGIGLDKNYTFFEQYNQSSTKTTITPVIGAEIDYVLGNNSKKTDFFVKLFAQQYTVSGQSYRDPTVINSGYDNTIEAKISSLNLNVGARYAFIATQKSKLSFELGIIYSYLFSSDYEVKSRYTYLTNTNPNTYSYYYKTATIIGRKSSFGFTVGLQYQYNSKFGVGVNYILPRYFLNSVSAFSDLTLQDRHSMLNLVFSYTFLKK